MIQAAPTCPDPARLLLGAPLEAFPVAFLSDPRRPGPLNRYTVIAAFPLALLTAQDAAGPVRLEDVEGAGACREFISFAEAVREALAMLGEPGGIATPPWGAASVPFTGGLAGSIDYEFGGHFERMPFRQKDPAGPALQMGLYGSVYVMDHLLDRAWWICRTGAAAELAVRRRLVEQDERLRAWIGAAWGEKADAEGEAPDADASAGQSTERPDWRGDWNASLQPAAYERAIERIHRYLRDGDIYQANLTVRHRRICNADPRALFGQLMRENPAPFSAFLGSPQGAVLSSSPELLLNLDAAGRVETRPIKGTAALAEDEAAKASGTGRSAPCGDLLASAKDRAEHLMIVDLERNDLGRVCRTGSVSVNPLFAVEKYRGLQHLVSGVRGRLRPGLGPCDALRTLLPGGSITGAPKIRAMEIIHELEPVARGVYTGALGWITPEGEARMNLAIRTLAQRGRTLDLHVGGGIVIDSDPQAEAEECRLKGEAMARAVRRAERQALEPVPRA